MTKLEATERIGSTATRFVSRFWFASNPGFHKTRTTRFKTCGTGDPGSTLKPGFFIFVTLSIVIRVLY